ncbi:MAG: hypothetical protein ABIH21_02275 [Patescibacteria group bacterium]
MKKIGASMIEVIIALGLMSIIAGSLVVLIYPSYYTSGWILDNQRALWVAEEGIEAINTMDFNDIEIIEDGALIFSMNKWLIVEGGPEQVTDRMTRAIDVEQVQRDSSCQIVESGGTVDEDTKKIVATVAWSDVGMRPKEFSSSRYITRWENPQGSCFLPTEAARVTIDISQAVWSGGKQLRQVYITNYTSVGITIDKIMLTWDYDNEIVQMLLGESKVWSSSGPGTPLGDQPSGTELDIVDVFLSGDGDSREMNKTQFRQNMTGSTLTMQLIFSDGSSVTTDPFIPSY